MSKCRHCGKSLDPGDVYLLADFPKDVFCMPCGQCYLNSDAFPAQRTFPLQGRTPTEIRAYYDGVTQGVRLCKSMLPKFTWDEVMATVEAMLAAEKL
jgi:hypothetical protein